MVLLSSEMVPLNSKMARRGSKTRPQTGGSFAGRSRVARGSAGRSRVADFSSRSGKTRVAGRPATGYILLYLSNRVATDPRRPTLGCPKKSVLGVYGGKGGFEFLIHQTEKTFGPPQYASARVTPRPFFGSGGRTTIISITVQYSR